MFENKNEIINISSIMIQLKSKIRFINCCEKWITIQIDSNGW